MTYQAHPMDHYLRCMLGTSQFPPLISAGHADNLCRHIEVNPEHHGNLFFWLFQNRHIANKQRTVIWLNGGPGCSSMDGALMEIGPYRVKEGSQKGDFKLEYNEGSWDEFANVVFVDQPVGTGFSYVDTDSYDHEMTDIADHMVVFLEKFFGLFPQYMHDDVGLQQLPVCASAHLISCTFLGSLMLAFIYLTSHKPFSTVIRENRRRTSGILRAY